MSDEVDKIEQFESYISWRMDSFSNEKQSLFLTVNDLTFRVRVFSESISDESSIENFQPITDFLSNYENSFFIVQVFTAQNGHDFGKITFWENTGVTLENDGVHLPVQKLLLVEFGFEHSYQYEIVIAI